MILPNPPQCEIKLPRKSFPPDVRIEVRTPAEKGIHVYIKTPLGRGEGGRRRPKRINKEVGRRDSVEHKLVVLAVCAYTPLCYAIPYEPSTDSEQTNMKLKII